MDDYYEREYLRQEDEARRDRLADADRQRAVASYRVTTDPATHEATVSCTCGAVLFRAACRDDIPPRWRSGCGGCGAAHERRGEYHGDLEYDAIRESYGPGDMSDGHWQQRQRAKYGRTYADPRLDEGAT